jgi:16S rRNA (guanine527-N7)-methyltransferase
MTMLDTALAPEVHELLRIYRDLLLRWNQRFNLTAITEPAEVDRRLVGDALRMLPALDDAIEAWKAGERRRAAVQPVSPRPRLIDIGSGAGFPGLVLKIARPELDLTLVDSTGKKVRFLENAISELGLENAQAVHSRAEELATLSHYRERFDITTARAVAALPALMELCIPFLQVGGHGIFPKGMEIEQELEAGHRAAKIVGARIVGDEILPAASGDPVTRLIIAVKIEPTPVRYPRRSGIPSKEPLGRVDR